MRVIYMKVNDKGMSLISYKGSNVLKCKFKPNKQIFTEGGVVVSKDHRKKNLIECEEFMMYSKLGDSKLNLSEYIEKIDGLLDDSNLHILYANEDARLVMRFLTKGETEDGIKRVDISATDTLLESITNKLKGITFSQGYYNETDIDHFISKMYYLLDRMDFYKTYTGKEFFTSQKISHPFIYGKYLVVDRDTFRSDDMYHFTCVNYPTEKEICRPLPNITEGLVSIKELPEYFIRLMDMMFKLMGSDKRLFVVSTDILFNTVSLRLLLDTDITLFEEATPERFVLKNSIGEDLIFTPNPPGLVRNIKDNMKFLRDKLSDPIDIKDKFFIGNTIDPSIAMNGQIVEVKTPVGKVRMLLGFDALERNRLKRIEKTVDTCEFEYKLYDSIVKFKTIIKLSSGDSIAVHSPFNGFNYSKIKG